jgi:hypothetical protein
MASISRSIAAAGSAALLAITAFTAGQATSDDPKPPADPDTRTLDAPVSERTVPGPANPAELLFVPIASCRAVDTRQVGKLRKNAVRNYYIAGATGFGPQGGRATGCGIPTSATAVVANLWAVKPEAAGNLKAWAAGASEPAGSSLYYSKSSSGTAQVTVPIRNGPAKHLVVKNLKGTTNLVIDVAGYYVPPLYAYISSGTVIDHSGRLVSSTKNSVGTYTLTWDRSVEGCVGQGSSDIGGYIVSVYTAGNISYVYVDDNAGNPADYWVNVTINC